jgi:nucleoside-diphosphate kinase
MLKPDALQRGLAGQIIARLEAKGLKIVAMKMVQLSRAVAERHYAAHVGKPFYEPLIAFVTSGPMVLMVLEGKDAVAVVRLMMGATSCAAAQPGTIRGDLGVSNRFNLIHGSDSLESAAQEIRLFFRPDELFTWQPAAWPWTYDFSTGEPV